MTFNLHYKSFLLLVRLTKKEDEQPIFLHMSSCLSFLTEIGLGNGNSKFFPYTRIQFHQVRRLTSALREDKHSAISMLSHRTDIGHTGGRSKLSVEVASHLKIMVVFCWLHFTIFIASAWPERCWPWPSEYFVSWPPGGGPSCRIGRAFSTTPGHCRALWSRVLNHCLLSHYP